MGQRILRIANNFLHVLMGDGFHGYTVDRDGLPGDAKVVGCRMSFDGRELELCVESEQFEPTPEGSPLVEITPMFTTVSREFRWTACSN